MTRRAKGGMVLVDGPAAGTYSTRRAPFYLRAVVDSHGRCDLLDQLNDRPLTTERVYVYEAEPGSIWDPDTLARTGTFLCPPPGAQGRYHHRPDVDGEQLRDTDAWRTWARAQNAPAELLDGVTLERRPSATNAIAGESGPYRRDLPGPKRGVAA